MYRCRSALVALFVALVGCGTPNERSFDQLDSAIFQLQDNYRVIDGNEFRQQAQSLLIQLDGYEPVAEIRFRKSFVLNMIAGSLKQDDRQSESIPYAKLGLELIRSVPPRQNSKQSSEALFTLELAFLQNLTWSYEYGQNREDAALYRTELIELLYDELTNSRQRCGIAFNMLVNATIEQNRYFLENGDDKLAQVQSNRLAAFDGCDGHVQRQE